MKHFPAITALGLLLICVGCFSRTYVGQSVDSPDKQLRCSVTIYGAYRHAYTDRTQKEVWVWIGNGSGNDAKQLFEGKYVISGPDVGWNTHWFSTEAVSIDFFDCGDGTYSHEVGKPGVASNHIATLSFHLNKQTGKFTGGR